MIDRYWDGNASYCRPKNTVILGPLLLSLAG
jgi:hypothetical protein